MKRAKRLVLVRPLFAGALTVQAKDPPLLIEFDRSANALPAAVSAAGSVVVGNLATGGAFYWMPTTGAIFIGGSQGLGVSRDGRTIVGVAPDNRGISQAAIWLRATEWQLLGPLRPDAVPCGASLSQAQGTNDDGRVVVGFANAELRATRAGLSSRTETGFLGRRANR